MLHREEMGLDEVKVFFSLLDTFYGLFTRLMHNII